MLAFSFLVNFINNLKFKIMNTKSHKLSEANSRTERSELTNTYKKIGNNE